MGVSAGQSHTVYLKSDGMVWATGKNGTGQLGDGTNNDRSNPVQVKNADGTGLSGVMGISAGDSHTVYLKSDGTVWAAGYNWYGQLGDGTTTVRNNPLQVTNLDGTGLSEMIGISAGQSHTVYLINDGTVWATGFNSTGQLGDGTTTNSSNPVQVTNEDGTELSEIVGISAGQYHTVYLKSDGTVWATGYNAWGQLGDGTTTQRTNPVQVTNADGTGLSGVVGISAGKSHTMYLKSDGTLWTVGTNNTGQLGDGTTTNRSNPVYIMGEIASLSDASILSNSPPAAINATVSLIISENQPIGTIVGEFNATDPDGDELSYHLTDAFLQPNNSLFSMDANGTLRTSVVFNYEQNASSYIIRVYARDEYNGTLEGNFTVSLQDLNEAPESLTSVGPLEFSENDGVGTVVGQIAAQDQDGDPLLYSLSEERQKVKQISYNWSTVLWLMEDGTVLASGSNFDGALGNGTTTSVVSPVQVVKSDGSLLSGVQKVAAGISASFFLMEDGTVWATGNNDGGGLGDGTTIDKSNPVQVIHSDGSALSGVVDVSAAAHCLFLMENGTVWATGYNTYGELGNGTTTNASHPTQVIDVDGSALSYVKAVGAGGDHSVFLKEDGTVWTVGKNTSGQLGDGTNINKSNPVQVIYSVGSPVNDAVEIGPVTNIHFC